MSTVKITGVILNIFSEEKYGHNFVKRRMWIQENRPNPNTWTIELWNADVNKAFEFSAADMVECECSVLGKLIDKPGMQIVINILHCINIKKV